MRGGTGAVYGPRGAWAALFLRAPGYLSTELLRTPSDSARYLTVDRWVSAEAFGAFEARWGQEYERLDRECKAFTVGGS